jgi:pimeloyl-ACP methyl ester carboxylesterase
MRRLMWMVLLLPLWLEGADLVREQRITRVLEQELRLGSAIRLKAQDLPVFGIFQEADTDRIQGGVILCHDMAGHADWLEVIHPLRRGLTRHGWETLSLQMPLASVGATAQEYEALLTEAFPRLQAAIDYYSRRQINQVVLLGHGLGGRMVLRYMAEKGNAKVNGLVLLGMAVDEQDKASQEALKKVKLPVLDLVGDLDLPGVLASGQLRRKMARYGGNTAYRQASIAGADHFFHGRDAALLLRVRGWLGRYISNANPAIYKSIK